MNTIGYCTFRKDIAKETSLSAAVVFEHIIWWCAKNKTRQVHFYDGKYWMYKSKTEFSKIFDVLTPGQIKRALQKLIEKNLISVGKYNSKARDNVNWYSYTDKSLKILKNSNLKITKTQEKIKNTLLKTVTETQKSSGQKEPTSWTKKDDQPVGKNRRLEQKEQPIKLKELSISSNYSNSTSPITDNIETNTDIYLSQAKNFPNSFGKIEKQETPKLFSNPEPEPKEKQSPKPKPKSLTQKNKKYEPLSRTLAEIVRTYKNIKIDQIRINSWNNHIRQLVERDGVDYQRIERALKWYSKNAGGDYVPVIESGKSLREKFTRLEDAIHRDKNPIRKNNNNSSGLSEYHHVYKKGIVDHLYKNDKVVYVDF